MGAARNWAGCSYLVAMYQAHFKVAYGEYSVVRVRPAVVAVPVNHVHIAADAFQPVICLLRLAQSSISGMTVCMVVQDADSTCVAPTSASAQSWCSRRRS